MKIFFTLLLIIFMALSGYHLTFRRLKLPLFARKLYLTGTEFLVLGLFMGPMFLNILDAETMDSLKPLYALLLGWIGLVVGFQFEVAKIRRFPSFFFLAAVSEGSLTAVFVFMGMFLIFPLIISASTQINAPVLMILTAAAVCAAQTGMSLHAGGQSVQNSSKVSFLRYISSFDSLMALLIFGVAYFMMSHTQLLSGRGPDWWVSLPAMMVLSIALLFIYMLFLSRRRTENELILIVIGMVVITSGTATVLNVSPLLINFFLGFCLSNVSREKERIFRMLIRIEKPVYLLLLVFLGGSWHISSVWVIVPAAAYCMIRVIGKFASGAVVYHLHPGFKEHSPMIGLGLLDQGGLPIAIIFDFSHRFAGPGTDFIVSLAILSIIMNDFISPLFLNRLLKDGKKEEIAAG